LKGETMTDETSLIIIESGAAIARAKRHSDIVCTMRSDGILRQGVDYGVIPGTNKPTLLKPGAERLCAAFGLDPDFELVNSIEKWDADAPMFHYQYKCKLIHIESGKVLATALGSCNSMEAKYRWRWLWPNEVQDMDTSGMVIRKTRNGKTQYRADNDDVFSIVNTIDKMAQKRALIAAVLIGCNASDHFTQDIEDMPGFGTVVEAEYEEVKPTPTTWATPDNLKVFFDVWNKTAKLSDGDVCKLAGIETSDQWGTKYATSHEASAAIKEALQREADAAIEY